MASSILEVLRGAHEEIEKLEEVAADLLLQQQEIEGDFQQQQQQQQLAPLSLKPKRMSERKRRESLRLQVALSDCLSRIEDRAALALGVYTDSDGLKREETLYLGGQRQLRRAAASGSSTDVWINFYDRVKEIRNLHKKRILEKPEEAQMPIVFKTAKEMTEEFMNTPYLDALFVESEAFGLRVDLETNFREFLSLKNIQKHFAKEAREKELFRLRRRGLSEEALASRLESLSAELLLPDYLSYLRSFYEFNNIPRYLKYNNKDYFDYLTKLKEYLQDFFTRRNPLADPEKVHSNILTNFDSQFPAAQIPGWEEPTHKNPLFCLVTNKLFSNNNTLSSHQQGSRYRKALLHHSSLSPSDLSLKIKETEETDKQIAFLEFQIKAFADLLQEPINQTIAYHQKKQSTNAEEAEEADDDDSENEEAAAADDEESEAEEEGPVYNPLNLPLGFDGRPIPYWLYKLHGLGKEFKCEICGNFSYWGRRAFERHFSEWRHSFGMRCLKIPNTTHFKEITKIEDAIMLYEKLKKQAEGHAFKQEQELECEDAEGNVMNLRAFEDLRRQGLI